MYQHTIEPFGPFQKHILRSADGADQLTFVPEYGACMLELRLRGVSVLDGYSTPQELQENRWSKNIVLYPFPNRLKGGRYQWQGHTYQFSTANSGTGNALHGFGRDRAMRVLSTSLHEDAGAITCVRDEPGTEPAYPFAFQFSITFALLGQGQFEATLGFQNQSTSPLLAGTGWHPYFTLSPRVNELTLELPPCEAETLDRFMIPTGKRAVEERFRHPTRIGDIQLDSCFRLDPAPGWAGVRLHGDHGRLWYAQETGADKFNYLQVFIPHHRQSIAIEPMSCNIDAFNNGEGLSVLAPGAGTSARVRVRLEP